jgi:hypothetical protein
MIRLMQKPAQQRVLRDERTRPPAVLARQIQGHCTATSALANGIGAEFARCAIEDGQAADVAQSQ